MTNPQVRNSIIRKTLADELRMVRRYKNKVRAGGGAPSVIERINAKFDLQADGMRRMAVALQMKFAPRRLPSA
jgi:hypothetical protein